MDRPNGYQYKLMWIESATIDKRLASNTTSNSMTTMREIFPKDICVLKILKELAISFNTNTTHSTYHCYNI